MDKIKVTITTNDYAYGENLKEFQQEYELDCLSNLTKDVQPIVCQDEYDLKSHNGSFLIFKVKIEDDFEYVRFELNEITGHPDMFQQCKDLETILLGSIVNGKFDFKKLTKFHDFENYQWGNSFNMPAWEYFNQTGKQLKKISYCQAQEMIWYQMEKATQEEVFDQASNWENTISAMKNFLSWLNKSQEYKIYLAGPHPRPTGKKINVEFDDGNDSFCLAGINKTKQEVIDMIFSGKNVFVNDQPVRVSQNGNEIVLDIENGNNPEWTIYQEAAAQHKNNEFENQLDPVGTWDFSDKDKLREVTTKDGKFFYEGKEVTKKQIINSLSHTQRNILVDGKKIKLRFDHLDFEFEE